MNIHTLKTDHEVFNAVVEEEKTYEIRYNDRDFKVDDILFLVETEYTGKEMKEGCPLIYTGRFITVKVTHILYGPIYGLREEWVIMSIKIVKSEETIMDCRDAFFKTECEIPPVDDPDEPKITLAQLGIKGGNQDSREEYYEKKNEKGLVLLREMILDMKRYVADPNQPHDVSWALTKFYLSNATNIEKTLNGVI